MSIPGHLSLINYGIVKDITGLMETWEADTLAQRSPGGNVSMMKPWSDQYPMDEESN